LNVLTTRPRVGHNQVEGSLDETVEPVLVDGCGVFNGSVTTGSGLLVLITGRSVLVELTGASCVFAGPGGGLPLVSTFGFEDAPGLLWFATILEVVAALSPDGGDIRSC
jgi:hypothetical protein